MMSLTGNIIPIFIFPPEQIDKIKNKYFSNNSVQFMIESLLELNHKIKKLKSKIYFFKGDNIVVLKEILKNNKINSIGFNIDYSPYAIKRDKQIEKLCKNNKIELYKYEDYPMYNITDSTTYNKSGKPYTVFTPFRKNLEKTHIVRTPSKFKKFTFGKEEKLKLNKFYFKLKKLTTLYINNPNINVKGGRKNGIKILKKIKNWNKYNDKRNCLTYKTTFLSAYLHFNVVSIREVYYTILNSLGKNNLLLNELHWRDFYMNISFNFPNVLKGMISKKKYFF